MTYKEYIQEERDKFIGKIVEYEGCLYRVVDVDYNGGLLIDKKARYTDTTAVESYNVKVVDD